MFDTRNDLPVRTRLPVIELLNARLADAIDFATQAKYAHWNVQGPQFSALHELFDRIAASFAQQIDTLAERATALGDADSADLFTGLSRDSDQQRWFLEAHLHAQR
jgi:starvation-inducible DNA-binding protein